MPSRGRRFLFWGLFHLSSPAFRNLWLIRRVSLFLLPQDWYNIPKIGSEKREKMKRRTKHRSNAFTHLYVPPTGSAHAHPPLCPVTMPLFLQPSPDACVSFMGVLRHKGDFLFSGRWGLCTACFSLPAGQRAMATPHTGAGDAQRPSPPSDTSANTSALLGIRHPRPTAHTLAGGVQKPFTPSGTSPSTHSAPQAMPRQAEGGNCKFFLFFAHFFFNPDKTCPGYLLNWS